MAIYRKVLTRPYLRVVYALPLCKVAVENAKGSDPKAVKSSATTEIPPHRALEPPKFIQSHTRSLQCRKI